MENELREQIEEAKNLLKPLIEKINELKKEIEQAENDKIQLKEFYEKQLSEITDSFQKREDDFQLQLKYFNQLKTESQENKKTIDDLKNYIENLKNETSMIKEQYFSSLNQKISEIDSLKDKIKNQEQSNQEDKQELSGIINSLKEQLNSATETEIALIPENKIDSNLVKTYRLGRVTEKVKDKFIQFSTELFKNSKKDHNGNWILNNLYESANNAKISSKDADLIIKRLLKIKKNNQNILTIDKSGISSSPLEYSKFIAFITETPN